MQTAKDQATATGNKLKHLVQFRLVVLKICKQTDRQTFRRAHHNTLHPTLEKNNKRHYRLQTPAADV